MSGKHSGLMNRISKLEFELGDPVKLKWLKEPSEKKIRKWEQKGYTVITLKVHPVGYTGEGEK